jgi:chemotaxis protein methyltransferase CheR
MSTESAVQRLAGLVREATGNHLPPSRLPFLAEVAERRAAAAGRDGVDAYVRALAAGELPAEWPHLIALLTVKEGYFFRAPQQFRVLAERLLPALAAGLDAGRPLRIWSAACGRGEEPATLAIVCAESPALAGREWTILATDLDEEALAAARRGVYNARAVAQVPPESAARWLAPHGACSGLVELAPELRRRIDYRPLNLARPPYALPGGPFDLVLLRNLLIYFRRPLQRQVMAEVERHLAPGGHLFLGASETLWQIHEGLAAVDLGDCYAYRHRANAAAEEQDAASGPAALPAGLAAAAAAAPPSRPVPVPVVVPTPLLAAARCLAAGERDAAAHHLASALAADPADPAAHAVHGLLHDLTGRLEEAVAAYRAALYLEPGLFQVRVLLGDCFLRLGHRDRAEQQFREVLATLRGGRGRALETLGDLPLPDRARAQRRSRRALSAA